MSCNAMEKTGTNGLLKSFQAKSSTGGATVSTVLDTCESKANFPVEWGTTYPIMTYIHTPAIHWYTSPEFIHRCHIMVSRLLLAIWGNS